VAQLDPVQAGKGAEVKSLLRRHRRDPDFARDVTSARELIEIEHACGKRRARKRRIEVSGANSHTARSHSHTMDPCRGPTMS
jgi:hypothetical protein